MEKNALGKGLASLIPQGYEERERVQNIPVDQIGASEFQPRHYFSENRLKDLSESIRQKGVIQPILVRRNGDRYEIIAGERRFRACCMLGLKDIPAIVKQVNDENLLELSLIENIQREELNRVEEAKAYQRLSKEFNMTHDQISAKVSKDRTTITNTLRLLELPEKIQNFLEANAITMGHAKTILSLDIEEERLRLCNRIIKEGLSVRQAEQLARQKSTKRSAKRNLTQDIHLAAIEEQLQHHLGTRVKLYQGKKRGKIVIDYYSNEDLNRVLDLIGPKNNEL